MSKIEIKQTAVRVNIPLSQLEANEGQLEGLPGNPREITEDKFRLLKQNLQNYPEMLEYRTLLVYPLQEDKYIVVGGNMRLRAMQDLKFESAPCLIIPAETSVEKLRAYTILDNNGFGKWEWNMIANEWQVEEMTNWGVDVWDNNVNNDDIDNFFQEIEKNDNEPQNSDNVEHITIIIPSEYADIKEDIDKIVRDALKNYQFIEII